MGSVDRVGTKMQWWCTLKANGVGFEYSEAKEVLGIEGYLKILWRRMGPDASSPNGR